MTWTYFTAYLDGTRFITKEERDELFDNLAALLAKSDCADAGYSVNSADLAATKSSLLQTDRVSLDGPGATNTKANVHAVIATAAAAFDNHSTAVATALSGEGISGAERDAIISSALDEFRLWNYYKRLIDALVCTPNCPTISSVQCRNRSASKTKCGHVEFGTASTPPKIYLDLTLSGTLTALADSAADCSGPCNSKGTYVFTGTCVFDPSTCADTATGNLRTTPFTTDCVTPDAHSDTPLCDLPGGSFTPSYTEAFTPTTHTLTGTGCDGAGSDYQGSAAATLSNEYTTVQLLANAIGALASATWSSFSGSCGTSFTDFSSDELTVTVRETQWKFLFSAATASAGCKLEFDIMGNGGQLGHICIDLAGGVSEYVYELDPPAAEDALYLADYTISAGAC